MGRLAGAGFVAVGSELGSLETANSAVSGVILDRARLSGFSAGSVRRSAPDCDGDRAGTVRGGKCYSTRLWLT